MGLFDSLVKIAQEKIEEQTEKLTKKIEAVPENIVKKLETIGQPKEEKKETPKPKRKAKHSLKPATSIEGISKQILAQRDSIKSNGFKEYEFIANSDCCEICAALNGKHFRISALKIGVNAPPMHEGCSCSICAYEDEEEYNEWLSKF